MSAATYIAMMAHTRIMTPNSFILIHQYSQGFGGQSIKHNEIKFQQVEGEKLMDAMYKIYSNHSKIPKSEIKKNNEK